MSEPLYQSSKNQPDAKKIIRDFSFTVIMLFISYKNIKHKLEDPFNSRKPDFLIEESVNYNSQRCVNARTCYKGFYFCSNSTPPFILDTSQATPEYYHDAMKKCKEQLKDIKT